jgi:hypothetical protein
MVDIPIQFELFGLISSCSLIWEMASSEMYHVSSLRATHKVSILLVYLCWISPLFSCLSAE